MTSFRFGLLLFAFAISSPLAVHAQGTTSSGSSSSGSRTTSGTSSTGSTSSQSGSTMSGSATGSSTAGTGGGGAGAGQGTLEQPAFTEFGSAQAQQGFVGRGNNNQTFVGSANAGQQTVDAGGTARFSGLGGGGGGAGGGGASTTQSRGSQMRVPQRIAFTVPALPSPVLSASLQGHFTALQQRLPGVSVASGEAGHVVLSGVVESEHAKKLAEAIARLEPGVRKITNELQVGTADASAPRLQP